ncbi:hypothetical protein Tco_0068901, partial [Tanacetum coccineum]
MLLYSSNGGLEVGLSPLTQTGMIDFAQRRDTVTLLKRIRRFFVTQDIGARAAVHTFNRIDFVIARGVGAQIVSRLLTNVAF